MFHPDHDIATKSMSKWEQSMFYGKSLQVLHRKKIFMITGSKVSHFTCKCVFYRAEDNVKTGPHGIEF